MTTGAEAATLEYTALKPRSRSIPLAIKVPYTVFCAVMIPYYWRAYGPANFLYFCDIAVLVTLVALWIENRLLICMQAVAILLPQAVWMVDFFSMAVLHKAPLGMTGYMFNPEYSLFVRGLSTFHIWLPVLLVWLIWWMGYDRRAFLLQVPCAWAVLLVCYLGIRTVNINYVYGMDDQHPQTWMHPHVWFAMLMVLFPVGIYLPTHLVLAKLFGDESRKRPQMNADERR